MLWIFYLFLFILAGILSWDLIIPNRKTIESILIGSLWGVILGSVFPFLLGLVFPFDVAVLGAMILALLISGITGLMRKKELETKLKKIFHSPKNWKRSFYILFIAFLIILIPYLCLISKILFINGDKNFTTGFRSAYGDVPFHLMYISSFVWGENFPPQNPDYAGTKSDYPFLPNIISASLINLGADPIKGYMAPIFVLNILIVALLIFAPWRITQNTVAAILVPIIFLLSGGLGFLWFFQAHGLNILSPETKFAGVFLDEPTNIPSHHVNLMNVMLSSLLPQRGVLFGLPIFLSVLILLFNPTTRSIIASALLIGSLPLLHPHTFIALAIVLSFFLIYLLIKTGVKKFNYRPWICFLAIIFSAAIPVLIFFRPNIGKPSTDFIYFAKGWMTNGDNFIWYWFKNLGLFLPLLIISLCSKIVPKNLKIWYLPFIPIFFIANFIIFSPWDFDNHKFFNLWYLVSSFLIAVFLAHLFKRRNLFLKTAATILLFSLILSGAIEATRLWHFSKNGFELFSPKSQELAEFIRSDTPPQSIFLASTSHLSPIILSGRKRFLGYLGWLSAHGIDYQKRMEEAKIIYAGGPEAKSLIKKNGITYVLIGGEELNEFSVNRLFFEEHFKKVYNKNGYQIFSQK